MEGRVDSRAIMVSGDTLHRRCNNVWGISHLVNRFSNSHCPASRVLFISGISLVLHGLVGGAVIYFPVSVHSPPLSFRRVGVVVLFVLSLALSSPSWPQEFFSVPILSFGWIATTLVFFKSPFHIYYPALSSCYILASWHTGRRGAMRCLRSNSRIRYQFSGPSCW